MDAQEKNTLVLIAVFLGGILIGVMWHAGYEIAVLPYAMVMMWLLQPLAPTVQKLVSRLFKYK